MKIINANINVGIGDIIYAKTYYDSIKNQYDEINLFFHIKLLEVYRNNYIKCENFTVKLIHLLFSELPYVIHFNNEDNKINSAKPTYLKPNLIKYFINSDFNYNLPKEYIVLTTKFRYYSIKKYEQIKEELFFLLDGLSKKYTIVILGEKSFKHNAETLIHADNYYCIYPDAIKYLSNNIIDLTSDDLLNEPDFNNFIRDCNIMRGAKIVFTIGNCGAVWMAISVAKVLNLHDMDNKESGMFMKIKKINYDDFIICDNMNEVKEKIMKI